MDSFALTPEEQASYDAIAASLKQLPTASQYNVLAKIAHDMNREIVKPGAVRVAAASAAAGAKLALAPHHLPNSSNRGKKEKMKNPDPLVESAKKEFNELPENKVLKAARDSLVAKLSGNPTDAKLKTEVSAISLELRGRYQAFRDAKGLTK